MEKLSNTYTAGLFDGEGCIHLRRYKQGRSGGRPGYGLLVLVQMTDQSIIERLRTTHGGHIRFQGSRRPKLHKPLWRWELFGQKAAEFLAKIQPWSIVKAGQIEIALKFQKVLRRDPVTRRVPLSEHELRRRERFYQGMRALNKRGVA